MRRVLFGFGLCMLAGLWLGPLPRLAAVGSFSAHMALHMGVVALAAPAIALGIAGQRFDPVRFRPGLWAPVPASIVELLVVWLWHAPALHTYARGSTLGFVLEQSTFLASGLFVWLAAFGGSASERPERSGQGSLALLLTSMHMTLLGALLALPPRALYVHAHGAHADGAAGQLTLSPLADQHLGGAIMLLVGGLAYLVGGLLLAFELLGLRKRVRSWP